MLTERAKNILGQMAGVLSNRRPSSYRVVNGTELEKIFREIVRDEMKNGVYRIRPLFGNELAGGDYPDFDSGDS